MSGTCWARLVGRYPGRGVIRENAKMHRRGLFRHAEVGKIAEERREAGRTARHDRFDRLPRACLVPDQRQDESAGALRCWIVPVEKGLDRIQAPCCRGLSPGSSASRRRGFVTIE